MTARAIEGVRKMPAHGGSAKLTDLEISRAVAYMVSGGHADGKLGAPRIGDLQAWQPRLNKGVEPLVKSAITGHKAMPARGGMNSLSDAEMRSAVVYRVNSLAQKTAK